jgi:hypothetical protein
LIYRINLASPSGRGAEAKAEAERAIGEKLPSQSRQLDAVTAPPEGEPRRFAQHHKKEKSQGF